MSLKYIIKGNNKNLEGKVNISGSKNSSLPIIGASLLNSGISKLYNIPDIDDIKTMIQILKILGCRIEKKQKYLLIDSSNAIGYEIPDDLMRKMRSSVMLAGAILGRNRKAIFSYPGGCEIGARPIDLHLNAYKNLGIDVTEDKGKIYCKFDILNGGEINLDFPSVGATENIILCSIFCRRRSDH